MNSLNQRFAELGNKIQTATADTMQKAEANLVNLAKATAKKPDEAAPIPTEVQAPAPAAPPPPLPKEEPEATPPAASSAAATATATPKKFHIADKFSGFTAGFKKEEEEEEVSDLVAVLARLFEVDPKAKKQHEMVQALDIQGIHTWRSFLLMAEEDITQLTKPTKDGEVPISQNAKRMLLYLKQFVMFNITAGKAAAKDPDFYTPELFDQYVEDVQLGRLDNDEDNDEDEDLDKPSRLSSIRGGISGFANKLKPGIRNEEGSIADILSKAKFNVFPKHKENGASSGGDDASVISALSEAPTELVVSASGSTDAAEVHNDTAFEAMKKHVDELTSKLETTAKNAGGKTNEEVQKLMVPLLAKLKNSQDKFGHMMEARKKKKEDKKEAAAEAEAGEPSGDDKKKRFSKMLSSAENATKKAFENAEKVAREAAVKTGIIPDKQRDASQKADEELKNAFQAEVAV